MHQLEDLQAFEDDDDYRQEAPPRFSDAVQLPALLPHMQLDYQYKKIWWEQEVARTRERLARLELQAGFPSSKWVLGMGVWVYLAFLCCVLQK